MTTKRYNELVKNFSHRLYGYAIKWMRDDDEAKDIVQETFVRFWENRKKIEEGKEKSWLFTTSHNLMVNQSKKMSKTEPLENSMVNEGVAESNFELKDLIDKTVYKLPDIQRSALLLRDLEGYNYNEIGKILKLNESQVKVYIFRARKKLKEIIKATDINYAQYH